MKRGLLVYAREDVPQNTRFIFYACESAQKNGLSLELRYADTLGEGLSGYDFAVMRTRAPKLSAFVEAAGLRCFNSARFNALANDKLLCYDTLHAQIPMLTSLDAKAHPSPPFLPCVVKPVDGHGGENVQSAYNTAQYKTALSKIASKRALVQPFADPGRDKRVYVLGGEVYCAMLRSSASDFRSNYTLGGKAEAVLLTKAERELVEAVQKLCAIDYAGVDIIYDNGRPVLNELEDPVGARMVYENTNNDIVGDFISYISKSLR